MLIKTPSWWQKPMMKILMAYLVFVCLLIIALAIKITWYGNNPLTAFYVLPTLFVAIIWGPVRGLMETSHIAIFISILCFIILLTGIGIYYRKHFWGRLVAVIGCVAWSFFGMLNLSIW